MATAGMSAQGDIVYQNVPVNDAAKVTQAVPTSSSTATATQEEKYRIEVDAENPSNAIPVAQFADIPGAVLAPGQASGLALRQNFLPPSAVFLASTSKDLAVVQQNNQVSGGVGVLFIRIGRLEFGGRFIVPRKIKIVAVLHGAEIDLTQAQFVHPVSDIEVVAVLGGCKVLVPDGVRLEMSGVGILGGFKEKDRQSSTNYLSAHGPIVRIRGVAVLGGVKAYTDRSKPPVAYIDLQ